MESSPGWSESALLSPSKARAQQAQEKDWASVDSWLSRRYPSKRLPAFERNEETLRILLALATSNESSDDRRSYIDRIEKLASTAYAKRSSGTEQTYQDLLKDLDSHDDLNALAESAVELDCPTVDVLQMSTAIVDLTSRRFTLDEQVHLAKSQMDILQYEQRRATRLLNQINQEHFQAPSDLSEQTSEHLRSAKHMRAKIAEYDDRLGAIQSTQFPQSGLEGILNETKDLQAESARLADLEIELKAFQSLPSNAKAAHAKLEDAREELLKLTRRRDQLFERLASPG